MKSAFAILMRFLAGEEGPTAVEYAVLVGFIILALVSAITSFKDGLDAMFGKAATLIGDMAK